MPRAPRVALPLALALLLLAGAPTGAGQGTLHLSEPVVMRAAAVAEVDGRFVGSTATITVTAASNGSGHVFLDTFPLAEIDMQGSARLAARVAAQLTGKPLAEHDFFFVLRSGSQIIGGPSAGATLAVGAVAALNGWKVRPDALMTGTIQPDGSVGPVGGIPEKAKAAADVGVKRFLFPLGEEHVAFLSEPQRPVNLTRYCAEELGIECIPVSDVLDAVGLMTDHAFVRPPLAGNVTGEEYRALLGAVSRELVRNAEALVAEAEAAVADLPAGGARTALAARLDAARETLERARGASANGTHYTAASLSFQAAIDAHHVRDSARVLASEDPVAEAAGLVRAAREEVARVRAEVESFEGLTTTTFEAVGAAQVRLVEAESRLALAEAHLDQGTAGVLDALAEAAWAHERAGTATFWLRIAERLPEGEPLSRQGVRDAARDALTTSGEEVAYVRAVFQTRGIPVDVGEPERRLREAEAAFDRGFHSAAMLTAIEASVRASVLLEVTGYPGGVPEAKLEQKREQAALAIQAARERGVEPFLAQSQYEFGLSLENPADRLAFLGLARVSANLAGLPGLFAEPRAAQSRFVGDAPSLGVAPTWVAAAFAVGLALGAGTGLVALMPRDDEDDAPAPPEEADAGPAWPPPPPTPVDEPTR